MPSTSPSESVDTSSFNINFKQCLYIRQCNDHFLQGDSSASSTFLCKMPIAFFSISQSPQYYNTFMLDYDEDFKRFKSKLFTKLTTDRPWDRPWPTPSGGFLPLRKIRKCVPDFPALI